MPVRDWDAVAGRGIIRALKHVEGALLPILHAIQDEFGFIDAAAVPVIADELNLTRAEVHGVISFYHDFRKEAPGRHIVKICRAEACQSVGGRDSEAHAAARLNTGFHTTSADGRYTLEPVYCLGNCACGPSAMIDGKLHGRVTPKRFDQLIDALEARRRILSQYNVGAQTRRTENVAWHSEDVLEIHPFDAENRGIRDGDVVSLASRVGETTLHANISDRMQPGVVYTTFHHVDTAANVVTTEYSDWATSCPEYKVTAVQVRLSNQKSEWQRSYEALREATRKVAVTAAE